MRGEKAAGQAVLDTQGHELVPQLFLHWAPTVCQDHVKNWGQMMVKVLAQPLSVLLKFNSPVGVEWCELKHHSYTKIVSVRCLVNSAEGLK